MVAVGRKEHLRLVAQATEGDRMDDPVPIALIGITRAALHASRGLALFFVKAAFAVRRVGSPGRKPTHLSESFVIFWPFSLVKGNAAMPCLASVLTKDRASASVLNGPVTTRFVARSGVV